ncbi:retrovirus-related pol polyprotein from transposon TNT 1-94 [Tanacetum coccineum]
MAVVEVPQTLEYKGGQLNAAPVLEVENFTNWKKRFMCHIIGIEPQFENIIKNGPFIPMTAGQRKPEGQWTRDERKAANLDQRLKSLIMSILPDDQINSVINCLTAKSTWDDLILYHEGPSDVKEIRDFQDSPDDKEDTRSSQEYMNDLEEEYQTITLLAKSKRFFKKGAQRFSGAKATNQTECHKCSRKGHLARDCFSKTSVPSYQSPFQPKLLHSSEHKPELRYTKDFEAKYNKVKVKQALLNEEEVSSDKNEAIKVKALMALANEERVSVSKESASNGEWVKISIQKVHTLLKMEDNDDRESFLYYLCIDLSYIEEQRNNLLSKHKNLVPELNTCKEQLLILNQAKLDLLTMQHVNTEILKENQNLRNELKELTSITESWLNSSNKVNQYNLEVSITGSNKPKLSKAKDLTLSNHDTGKHPLPPLEKLIGAKLVFRPKTIKSTLKSNSTFKTKILKSVIINKPSSAPAKGNISTSVSKTNSTPAGKLKNVKIEDDTPLAICKRTDHRTCNHAEFMSSIKVYQHHIGQGESSLRSRSSRSAIPFPFCIHCGYNDHQSDDCVYYPTCELCGSYDHDTHGHNRIISLKRGIKPRNPQHVTKNYKTCGSNVHTTTDHNDIEWFKKREALQAKKAETLKTSKTESSSALRSKTSTKRWVSKQN